MTGREVAFSEYGYVKVSAPVRAESDLLDCLLDSATAKLTRTITVNHSPILLGSCEPMYGARGQGVRFRIVLDTYDFPLLKYTNSDLIRAFDPTMVWIHEAIHAEYPYLSEDKVVEMANTVAVKYGIPKRLQYGFVLRRGAAILPFQTGDVSFPLKKVSE